MRGASFVLGVALLAVAWLGPLPALAARAFAAHMTLHMAVVAIAAPLLAWGVAGRRWDPVRAAPRLFPPIPLSVVDLVVVWAWHAPALHHLARSSAPGFVAEQGMFLAAGLVLWLAVFGGAADARRARAGAGIVALILTSVHMTLLGALLALTGRPLYPHATGILGMTPLEDQHLGGAIMLLVGGAVYLAGGLVLARGLLAQAQPSRDAASRAKPSSERGCPANA